MPYNAQQLQALIATRQMTIDGLISYARSLVDYISAATMANIDCDWYVAKLDTTKRSIAQNRDVLQRLRAEMDEEIERVSDEI